MDKENALIVFQKNPALGTVKTRLASVIGDQKAVEVYRYLLWHTHQEIAKLRCPVFVFFDKEVQQEFLHARNFFPGVQCGRNLGEKMQRAFFEVFALGYRRVIIIGTDCLEIEAGIIDNAFTDLITADLVIGPAKDGGYYLLGLKALHDPIFEGKEWGTSTVLTQTLRDAAFLGLQTVLLKELSDVDRYEDLGSKLKTKLGIP